MESSSTFDSLSGNALSLAWAFGFQKDVIDGVQSLVTEDRDAVFYIAAHTGVIYDFATRRQRLLQGHCYPICAAAVSADKRWIVTADKGTESMLVVWDSMTGSPAKSIFNPHPNGCLGLDISSDGLLIATLSAPPPGSENTVFGDEAGPQVLSLWDWSQPGREDALLTSVVEDKELQRRIRFNPVDNHQLISCGDRRTLFWSWVLEPGPTYGLRGYAPKTAQRMKHAKGICTGCCFLPGTTQAVTATDIGEVVVWDSLDEAQREALEKEGDPEAAALMLMAVRKSAVKVLNLSQGAIRHISTIAVGAPGMHKSVRSEGDGERSVGGTMRVLGTPRRLIVVGGDDGAVRIYDVKFRAEAWFEDFNAGGINSVSFGGYAKPGPQGMGLDVPDFIIGTTQGYIISAGAVLFEELDPSKRRGTVLVQGFSDSVMGVATNPTQPQLAAACASGDIQLWDYELKVLMAVRTFDSSKLRPQCVAYHPFGEILAVGYTSGACRLLNSGTLTDIPGTACLPSSHPIVMLRFSPGGEMLAAADAGYHVLLWKRVIVEIETGEDEPQDHNNGAEDIPKQKKESWSYIGRYRSHSRPITGLEFGAMEDGSVALVSVAEDRFLVEYDLRRSTPETGLLLAENRVQIEESGTPTAVVWHPLLRGDFEDRIVTASDEFKLKQWNAGNKGCRRTSIGPAFGGPVNRLLPIYHLSTESGSNVPCASDYVAYSTAERVVGLVKLPLDGRPSRHMGLIAHPGTITSIAVSGDGSSLFTSGGADLTVNLWTIDTVAMDAQVGGESEEATDESFLEQLEGGKDGDLHKEIVDYFYYSQLRTQGEDTTESRELTGTVPLAEIPPLMRALGYYPTNQEVENMISEVKYSRFTESGEFQTSVTLPGLIRLFVNHRPLFPVAKTMLLDAFEALGTTDGRIQWARLCNLLMQGRGKKDDSAFTEEELRQCLEALTGEGSLRTIGGKMGIDANEFATKVLGFEDYTSVAEDATESDPAVI